MVAGQHLVDEKVEKMRKRILERQQAEQQWHRQ